MIIDCPAKCGKKVIAKADGKAYLCRPCWRKLFATLFEIIRSAPEPMLAAVQTIIEEEHVA